MKKVQVAVLGATGMIGQRFVQLLEDHPYFEIGGLYASERSEGKSLGEVMKLKGIRFQEETLATKIESLDPKAVAKRNRLAFSGLPTEVAKDTESSLAELGVAVFPMPPRTAWELTSRCSSRRSTRTIWSWFGSNPRSETGVS